ncbi:uncharacterized protein [Primulina eburnea]|uniref:uncharacterized protein n=1 Tax=Primulina eburnea TaxID=1245227 RepID=UPI003C6C6269
MAVSSVLIKQKGTEQSPVYYISHALKGAELRYTVVEKLALALVTTAQRLRSYFLSHPIMVLTNSPLGRIMTHADISGRLVKWTTELGEYDIQYGPGTAIRAQALADFLAETLHVEIEDLWKVYVDGSATNEGSGVGVLLISPKGDELKLAVRLDFRASNNEAEYEAVLAGLRAAQQVGAARVHLFSDSQLVAHQMNGSYDIKNERLIEYVKAVEAAKELFTELVFKQILREENEGADSLAKMARSLHSWKSRDVVVQLELSPSLYYPSPESEDNEWRAELLDYMKDRVLPKDPKKAYMMKRRSLRFILVNGTLYKRSASRPLLKCLGPKQSNYVLREIHEGCCGNHLGSYFLARKALLAGYFWPTMLKDALAIVISCNSCQRHAKLQHQPAALMKSIVAACPFDQWEIDIVGPFLTAPAQKKFLLVAIDYFSKWVEAEALARITENECNGQVEVINRSLVQSLKTRLGSAKGNWVEELPSVLWSYRTTPKIGTGETPFSLVYGNEAVLPAEIGEETSRVGDLVWKKVQEEKVGKLDPRWEGPFKVVEKLSSGAYYLKDWAGKKLERPLNAYHLRKYYA